jgi:dTDP-4-dehydrorhamnose reductase
MQNEFSQIIVLGGQGFLGRRLVSFLRQRKKYQVYSQSRRVDSELNLSPSDFEGFKYWLWKLRPSCIINLNALTDVDLCEQNPRLAYELNSKNVRGMSEALAEYNAMVPQGTCHLVHLSTDQLYQGAGPHSESDANPINTYGKSKLNGEQYVLNIAGTVLRTNFVGKSAGTEKRGFTDWVYETLVNGKKIYAFKDIMFSPIHIEALCHIIELIMLRRIPGVFNVGASSALTKADFILAFAGYLGLSCRQIELVSSSNLPGRAARPVDMTMEVSRFEKTFRVNCPRIDDVIRLAAREYGSMAV